MKRIFLFLTFALTFLFLRCADEETIELLNEVASELDKERKITIWYEGTFSVGPQSDKYVWGKLNAGDTLVVYVEQLQGDYIAKILLLNYYNFQRWNNYKTYRPIFSARNITNYAKWIVPIPASDTYYFLIYNDAYMVTIKVYVKIIRIYWQ